jgi:Zn-dependent M28 family amino/carboxypeptidase
MKSSHWFWVGWVLFALACGDAPSSERTVPKLPDIPIPAFSGDSAYQLVARQVAFGPRVPNTDAHRACAKWLEAKLNAYGAKVIVQNAEVQAFDGTSLYIHNLIASFEPEKARRVMLSAHWDTRPFADQDSVDQDEPIPGANDGGSGVAVLLEMARAMQSQRPEVGIDLFLWDAEDYGKSEVPGSYCLGTQHWVRNPHQADYLPMYGINLDMVGAKDAYFAREGVSLKFAPKVVENVWQAARRLGHDRYFKTHRSAGITDDHVYVNEIARIPMIDIIDQPQGEGFFEHWHTHRDDMDAISVQTLQAVGETLLEVVYRE